MTRRRELLSKTALLFIITGAIFAGGCGGSLYKVKPAVELPPLTGEQKSATASGLTIRAAPLLTDEESQELFEANLPLSGVLPLRVILDYDTGAALELKKLRFKLRDNQGREWKHLSGKQAVSKIMKANGITLYNPNSRKQFEQEFSAYELDTKSPLNGSEKRQGFLFFAAPEKGAVESPQGLKLQIEKLQQPLELALN